MFSAKRQVTKTTQLVFTRRRLNAVITVARGAKTSLPSSLKCGRLTVQTWSRWIMQCAERSRSIVLQAKPLTEAVHALRELQRDVWSVQKTPPFVLGKRYYVTLALCRRKSVCRMSAVCNVRAPCAEG